MSVGTKWKLISTLALIFSRNVGSSKLGLTLSERRASDVDLDDFVRDCRVDDNSRVPNIVHYIWFGCSREFLPYHYLSVLSAISTQNACRVFFHTDCEPKAENNLFQHLKSHRHFHVIEKAPPTQIFRKPIARPEHQADVARIELLMRYGGIYLDDTQIVTRSLDPLRRLSCTLPYEKPGVLMNGVVVAEPNAPFLKKWFFQGYQDFEDHRWAWNSCRKPYFLWEKYPGLLHIEKETFLPSWDQWEELFFDNHYPWRERNNYAVHIYHKRYRTKHSMAQILNLNNTVGDLARFTFDRYDSWAAQHGYDPSSRQI